MNSGEWNSLLGKTVPKSDDTNREASSDIHRIAWMENLFAMTTSSIII